MAGIFRRFHRDYCPTGGLYTLNIYRGYNRGGENVMGFKKKVMSMGGKSNVDGGKGNLQRMPWRAFQYGKKLIFVTMNNLINAVIPCIRFY
jgi:hypothetical protein